MQIKDPIWQEVSQRASDLGISACSNHVRKWWDDLENYNQDDPDLMIEVLDLIEFYRGTIEELWLAYSFSLDQELNYVLNYFVFKKINQVDKSSQLTAEDFLDFDGLPRNIN